MNKNTQSIRTLARRTLCCLAISTIALGSLTGCNEGANPIESPSLVDPIDQQVDTYTVSRRDVYTVEAYEVDVIPELVELSFASSGLLEGYNFSMGDAVKAGDILATLQGSSSQYEALQKQYDSMVENNAYQNRLTEIDIEIAKLSGQDTTRSELLFRQAKESQQFELDHLQKQIDEAKASIASAQIVAPSDGIIASLAEIEDGGAVSAESPVIALASHENAYVVCKYISEKQIEGFHQIYLTIGDTNYDLTYVPYEDQEELANEIKAGTALSTFRIDGDAASLIGQIGTIFMVKEYTANAIAVPINSLYKEKNDYYVYVMDGDTRVQTSVEVGIIGAMYAEILSGIEEGVNLYVKE